MVRGLALWSCGDSYGCRVVREQFAFCQSGGLTIGVYLDDYLVAAGAQDSTRALMQTVVGTLCCKN